MDMKGEIHHGSFKVEDAEFNFDFGFYTSTDLQTKLDSLVFRVGNQINSATAIFKYKLTGNKFLLSRISGYDSS